MTGTRSFIKTIGCVKLGSDCSQRLGYEVSSCQFKLGKLRSFVCVFLFFFLNGRVVASWFYA